jgi:seryl-tRNA synthetase
LDSKILDEIQSLHAEYTRELFDLENANKMQNINSKRVQQCTKDQSSEEAVEQLLNIGPDEDFIIMLSAFDSSVCSRKDLINIGKRLKTIINKKEISVPKLFEERNDLVFKIPNLLHESVPVFKSEQNNVVLFDNCNRESKRYDQYELCQKLGIIEDGSDIAGNRGYFLTNEGVRLNYALINYALEFLENKKYKLMYTPHFIEKKHMKNICQLSEFEETLYEIKGSDHYLIATSEQPMTTYFTKTKLNELPVMLCGISTCYRKEAGSHGRDTLGIFRVHQFEKIEQFCVTSSENSWEMMEQMIENSKEFYDSLGLTYRVVNIVSKELNNAASMKYDLEGWFPGSNKYRELVSCSNTTDYFSRKIKCKDSKDSFVHMLNSTLCANTRTICCILETHQCEDGVNIPLPLQKYYQKEKILFKHN